jgi:hypothetical protein
MRKSLDSVLLILIVAGFLLWILNGVVTVGQTYLSSDSLRLQICTYDTTLYPTLANADSVRWFRINQDGVLEWLHSSVGATDTVLTGVYSYKIAACTSASVNYPGYYAAVARAFKGGKRGAKTWTWKVVPGSGSRVLGTNDSTAFKNFTVGTATNLTTWNLASDTSFTRLHQRVRALMTFWGADSLWKIVYFPSIGTANKDSARIQDGSGNWQGSIIFHHSNVPTVYDTSDFIWKR